MTFENLLHQVIRCKKRASFWALPDLLRALEAFGLRHRGNPDMLAIALECRVALKSLLEKENNDAEH